MKIKIACLSIGAHAQKNILPAISQSSHFSLVGIFTRNQEILGKVSKSYAVKAYSSEKDLLANCDCEIVYISSPTSEHFRQIMLALENGRHVLVEKSAFHSLRVSEIAVKFANSRGLQIHEAFMYMYHSQFLLLKEMIESGKYGNVKNITARFGFPHLSKANIRYKADLKGGALLDTGTYLVSCCRELIPSSTFEVVGSFIHKDPNVEVDTFGSALLRNEKNVSFNLTWGFGLGYKNQIEIWTDKCFFSVERAFSKPPNLTTLISVTKDCNEEKIVINPDNHFAKMFEKIHGHIKHSDCCALNRKIIDQINLLERIRDFSTA